MKNKIKGFTLIEALTLLFIFSLITLTFYNVISLGTRYIQFAKNKLGAVALANEKMEIVRNLAYANVGVVGGACAGNIAQDEDVTENSRTYHVHTLAAFVDDPFDGTLGGSPRDTAFEDYKIVKVTVSWNTGGANQGEVALQSRFVPPGLEAATANEGILSINVFDSAGHPVADSQVKITNGSLGFSETRNTDDAGNVMIVGADESINRYALNIIKSGYETVNTFLPYPDTAYNPTDTHASVVAGTLNVTNIVQNQISDLTIHTQTNAGQDIGNIAFSLSGGRVLGHQVLPPNASVYNLNANDTTGADGKKVESAVSPGSYKFSLAASVINYALIGTDPSAPFSVIPGQNLTLNVKLAPVNIASLLVTVKNSAGKLLSGAQVKVDNGLDYNKTLVTDGNGTAYFPVSGDPTFNPGQYNLTVTADGFQTKNSATTVSAGQLKNENIILTAI